MTFQISRLQMMILMFWVVMGTGILTMPLAIAHFTIRDGWIAALLFFVGSTTAAAICWLYAKAYPKTSLSDALVQSLGPYFGSAVALWFVIWLAIHTALIARQLLVFTEITILPQTPLPVIAFALFLPVTYGVSLGIEVIVRFGEFITPIALPISLLLTVLTIPNMHAILLLPILADGWTPVLQASLQPAVSFALQLILVLQILPHLRHPETVGRDIFLVGAISTMALLTGEVVIITILGGSANYLQYPILEAVRGIQIGRFIQRLDTLYVMGVVAVIFLKVAACQYLFVSSLKSVVRLQSLTGILMPASAVTGAATIFLWRDTVALSHYMLSITPAYFAFTLGGLPLLAAVVKLIRPQTGQTGQTGQKSGSKKGGLRTT